MIEIGNDGARCLGAVVGSTQGDRSDPVGALLDHPDLVGRQRSALGLEGGDAAGGEGRLVVRIGGDEVALRIDVGFDEQRDALAEQALHRLRSHPVVLRLARAVPWVRKVVNESGHLELQVVGVGRFEDRCGLQAVVELAERQPFVGSDRGEFSQMGDEIAHAVEGRGGGGHRHNVDVLHVRFDNACSNLCSLTTLVSFGRSRRPLNPVTPPLYGAHHQQHRVRPPHDESETRHEQRP